jgi:hypothetical protein
MKQRRLKMATELKGAIELRKALREFAPDLAKETQKELAALLKPITTKAKGFIPSTAPLSGWGMPTKGRWERLQWSSSEAKRGIGFRTTPSKPNRSGFRSLARIVNSSAAGALYETAGRKNPQGRPQAPAYEVRLRGHSNFGKTIRSGNKDQSNSNNPNAGQQFIDALNEYLSLIQNGGAEGKGNGLKSFIELKKFLAEKNNIHMKVYFVWSMTMESARGKKYSDPTCVQYCIHQSKCSYVRKLFAESVCLRYALCNRTVAKSCKTRFMTYLRHASKSLASSIVG